MANYCFNTITFTGDDLSLIRGVIEQIKVEEEKGLGWIPEGFSGDYHHYLFDVCAEDYGTEIVFTCQTKWAPPIEELVFLCKDANIDIELQYEESGNLLYGVYYYSHKTKETTNVCLEDEDFVRVVYDDETNTCTFDGKEFESECEAYEQMLQEKL